MRFAPVPEPPDFDIQARKPGQAWLATHSAGRPRDFWTPFKKYLADGFGDLCCYSIMYEPIGTVDHFISCDEDRSQAYEWDNYRFANGWLNNKKRTIKSFEMLDPYQVEDDWFEILLPSLQLVLTDKVPAHERKRAEFTLKRLWLCDSEPILRQRRAWYELYQTGNLTLEGLEKRAPLIARAVRKQLLKVEPGEK